MGRKPNPVILDHFERGAKLNDNSNRYHHTCRNCGQEFDRGRHEQLTAHMTDDCPSLTDEERARILLKLHGLEHAAQSAPHHQQGTSTGLGRNFDLPFSPSRPQNFDGLNVLAEASRRVGIQPPKKKGKSPGRNPPLDPALAPDLPNEFVNNSDDGFDGYVSAANGMATFICSKISSSILTWNRFHSYFSSCLSTTILLHASSTCERFPRTTKTARPGYQLERHACCYSTGSVLHGCVCE